MSSPLARKVDQQRDAVLARVRQHRGRSVAVFGSVGRGEDRAKSDIDFLVEFEPGSSLFDLMHLEDDLTELLGCAVDVVSLGGLLDRDDHIRRDAVPL